MKDTFGAIKTFQIADRSFLIASLPALEAQGFPLSRLPYSLRILLENLLRREDGNSVEASDIEAIARWDASADPATEIAFMPARVLLQDFTGVPAVADLAAMRDAMRSMGGDPRKINPVQPVELVIDHSVQVDAYGSDAAFLINVEKEFERNRERYAFLRWGQQAFENFRVVPPGTGIVHQVNLECLARVVMTGPAADGSVFAYPDTLVGTDSHTTMVNGLGVLGWGVGGIEAEAAMLGQPVSMLVPQVVGMRLTGGVKEGVTTTDLVLTVTEQLRAFGVVGKFVEFFGPGLSSLSVADRATIANMAPEYGATCGIFPIDEKTLDYLRLTGRDEERVNLVEAYTKEQGLFHAADSPEAKYTDVLHLDLGSVVPSVAGPRRPQDRIALTDIKANFLEEMTAVASGRGELSSGGGVAVAEETRRTVAAQIDGETVDLADGSVVIAAITSCTNTSNPAVMLAAGLVARKAVELGLKTKPWVKTSLAPGSKVVTDYLAAAGLTPYLDQLGFNLVGYGCTTCIGNSGPLRSEIAEAITEGDLVGVAVLSGNRNFEGRISPHVRANYLASPPLVVAYAIAGRIDFDPYDEPLAESTDGTPIYLKDLWPDSEEIQSTIASAVTSETFVREYGDVYSGDQQWADLPVPEGDNYAWDRDSTYVRQPPFFDKIGPEPEPIGDLSDCRVLALLGSSVTTDHISPAGAIKASSPAGRYLIEHGVDPVSFNSYGSRRGNHEVLMRGTFANIRLRNLLVPGVEGGETRHLPDGEQMSIFDAAMQYVEEGVPLVILAGKEYGTGSSRDWAAKGPLLQGVKAVIAESFERIHRSNLVGMGIAPLQFASGDSVQSLGLSGEELFDISGLQSLLSGELPSEPEVSVRARAADGSAKEFRARLRLDTPQEAEYYRHGGILTYVLRQLRADS